MRIKFFILLALAALLSIPAVRGATVGYTFSGTVSTAWGNPFNGIAPRVGDPITGLFTYDTATSLVTNASTHLEYYGQVLPNRVSLTLDGANFQTGPTFTMYIVNDSGSRSPYDAFDMYDYNPSFPGAVPNNSLIEINLTDFTGQALSDTSLPQTLNLAAFNSQNNNLETVSGGVNSGVTFQITSLTPYAVPEPGAALLLLAGLGCLSRILGSRR